MKVIVTGGGTAGHVTPLLAVVSELRQQLPESHIRYIGQINDPMRNLIDTNKDIERHYSILAGKWRRYHGLSLFRYITDIVTLLKNIRDAIYFSIGISQSLIILLFWRPNVIFVKGGFVGLPVGLAGALLGIPIVTHDSDSVPGLTNRILSKYAKLQCVALPTKYYLDYYNQKKLRHTGIPIRQEFYNVSKHQIIEIKKELSINNSSIVITVIGGSLGAVRLNNAILKIIKPLTTNDKQLIWITGNRQLSEIKHNLEEQNIQNNNLLLLAFSDKVYQLLAISDVVISRAGATSIAELSALSKPTVLVPNPYLVGAHQTKNALLLHKDGAAEVVSEDQINDNPMLLFDKINNILDDQLLRSKYANNINRLSVNNASVKIANVIKEAAI